MRMKASKKLLFASAYVRHGSAERAMLDAGYSAKVARSRMHECIRDPEIQKYIADIRAETIKHVTFDLAKIVNALALQATFDIRSIVEVDEYGNVTVKPSSEWPPGSELAVQSVSQGKHGTTVKLVDKPSALDKLMRYLGGYAKDPDDPDKDKVQFNLVIASPETMKALGEGRVAIKKVDV